MIKNRFIFNEVEYNIYSENNKVVVLLWPRQVWKTTIMKYFVSELENKMQKVLFLDLDIYKNYEKVESYNKFINYLKINWYNENDKNYYYVFLDEFQKYKDFTKVLKNIYDNNLNIKIIVSWSSSLTIKNNVSESLAWRKRIINIYPLKFKEFLLFKNEQKLYDNYENISNLKWKWLYNSLENYYVLLYEFMIFGWYPAVVLEDDYKEKQKVLADIFDLFIRKDLWEYLKIDKIKIVKDILKFIAINNWWKIRYQEIAEISNVSMHTIKNYIEILKELFLFIELKPYYTNKNLEIVKMPKIYFIDNWVRNYFIKNFIELDLRQDKWELFEWFVLWEFIKMWVDIESIKYWNDKNKREVDLIIDNISKIIPYEIKFKKIIKSKDLLWLKAFTEKYNVKGNLINLDINSETEIYNFLLSFDLWNI